MLQTVWTTNDDETPFDSDHPFRVLHRIVTPHPLTHVDCPDASIVTQLEQHCDTKSLRVAIYSGPECLTKDLHVSFQLPPTASFCSAEIDAEDQSSSSLLSQTICWASFPERPTHLLLCVLVNPTTVSIWDAYPKTSLTSSITAKEANVTNDTTSAWADYTWSVPLPFECGGIMALSCGGGLLLQRRADPEEHQQPYQQTDARVDGFFLQSPKAAANSNWTSNAQNEQHASHHHDHHPSHVSSLFSLQHPLEDVLPVCQVFGSCPERQPFGSTPLPQGIQPRPIADPLEEVLWVGCADWVFGDDSESPKLRRNRHVICVTYHTRLRRHAIWSIQDAPPPPAIPPLHQRTRHNPSLMTNLTNRNSGFGGGFGTEDFGHPASGDSFVSVAKSDVVPFGGVSTPIVQPTTTRDEALADALGVRRTPRMSMDRSIAAQNRASLAASAGPQSANASVTEGPMFMSPRSEHDTSFVSTGAVWPLGAIHATVSLQCLYQEATTSCKARDVCVISNLQGSGKLILCLAGPRSDSGSGSDPKYVRMYELRPQPGTQGETSSILPDSGCPIGVEPLSTFFCRAAMPVKTTPVPCCYRESGISSLLNPLSTELLVLKDTKPNALTLYRADTAIVDYQWDAHGLETVSEMYDANHDRLSLVLRNKSVHRRIRVKVSLRSTSRLAEDVLRAVDAALFQGSKDHPAMGVLALKLRADVFLVEQRLTSASPSGQMPQDVGFTAVKSVLASIFHYDLFGTCETEKPQQSIDNDLDGPSAWEALLASEFHKEYSRTNEDFLFLGPTLADTVEAVPTPRFDEDLNSIKLLASSTDMQALNGISSVIFDAVHLLYEELKLSPTSLTLDLPNLGSLLFSTASLAGSSPSSDMKLFLAHYWRDIGGIGGNLSVQKISSSGTVSKRQLTNFSEPPSIFDWVDRVLSKSGGDSFFDRATPNTVNAACKTIRSILRIFSIMGADYEADKEVKVVRCLLDEGFDDPTMIREGLPPGIALPILEVLYRCRNDELEKLSRLEPLGPKAWRLVGREDMLKNTCQDPGDLATIPVEQPVPPDNVGGWDSDRFADVDNDGLVPLEKASAMIFPDDNRIHEAGRLVRSSRPIFLRVHRAVEVSDHDYERLKQKKLLILSTRTLSLPVGRGMMTIGTLQPVEAEPLPIPELCLKGRVPATNSSIMLDESESHPRVWPDFHNGVAAGLRLPLAEDSAVKITRTWIIYNRPPAACQNSAEGDDAVSLLHRQGHAHGGLLLALGLRKHLTALEMSDVYEYLTQGSVTTTVGVLLGMAANKRGSCDMAVSKMLCLHIPSLIPQHFSAIDVASSVQSAAVIGAGILFQKSSHRMMTEFLLNEIGRRPESDASAFDRESYTLSCGLALGMVNLCLGQKFNEVDRAAGIADLQVEERLYRYMVGGVDSDERRRRRETNDRFSLPSASPNGDNERCSTIYEGGSINTDVTAAGSTLALGLMYMKTGNQTIASALALPDTHFLLEFVRPDFLALRLISRALILWDDVKPTNEWIDAQIPVVIQNAYDEMRALAKKTMEGEDIPSKYRYPEYDRRAVRQIRAHLIAGACFGMGLRFAGTGDEKAKGAIMSRVLELLALVKDDAISMASRPELPILDSCLACATISLAMVLSGSGDLDALRLFKILRWRCDEDSRYGIHMIYGMATGLLFLGGGRCILGREPEDIAALVTAFFPRFPTNTTDNEYHLQALRHLYALATKRQDISAVDVDTGAIVRLPLHIYNKGLSFEQSPTLSVPCLLRNSDIKYEMCQVLEGDFYALSLPLAKLPRCAGGYRIYVKRRISNVNKGQKSYGNESISLDQTRNTYLGTFAEYLYRATDSEFLTRAMQDCVEEDAEEALALYLELAQSIPQGRYWDLRLVRTYCKHRHRISVHRRKKLVNSELLLAYLQELADDKLVKDNSKDSSRFALSLYGN